MFYSFIGLDLKIVKKKQLYLPSTCLARTIVSYSFRWFKFLKHPPPTFCACLSSSSRCNKINYCIIIMITRYCCYVRVEKKIKTIWIHGRRAASRECGGERRNYYYGRRNVSCFRFGINYTRACANIHV